VEGSLSQKNWRISPSTSEAGLGTGIEHRLLIEAIPKWIGYLNANNPESTESN